MIYKCIRNFKTKLFGMHDAWEGVKYKFELHPNAFWAIFMSNRAHNNKGRVTAQDRYFSLSSLGGVQMGMVWKCLA